MEELALTMSIAASMARRARRAHVRASAVDGTVVIGRAGAVD